MTLEEIRAQIDGIDNQLKDLLMQRLDCSHQIAEIKRAADSTDIYRGDREAAILKRLSEDVPGERKAPYVALLRKLLETSRMYQYGMLYQWNPELFNRVSGSELLEGRTEPTKFVTVQITQPDQPNALSKILTMIGDYGYNMVQLELLIRDRESNISSFRLAIAGNLQEDTMKNLMFQLSKECMYFRILSITE